MAQIQLTNTFLHRLPDAELLNVVRRLSAQPQSEAWQGSVSLADVLTLLRCGGPLAECAQSEFRQISSGGQETAPGTVIADGGTAAGRRCFEELFARLAPTLKSLCISRFRDEPLLNISTSLRKCTSLLYLSVNDFSDKFDIPAVLAACSGKLLSLSIKGTSLNFDGVNAIVRHCKGLMNLEIRYERIGASLTDVWNTVGPTLVYLTIFKDAVIRGNGFEQIDKIAACCVKVEWLEFGGRNEGPTPHLVRLCEKFGSQLKLLQISNDCPSLLPPASQIRRILDACPDLQVDTYAGDEDMERVSVFGNRVRSLITKKEPDCDVKEIGQSLLNLEVVGLIVGESEKSGQFLSDLLSSPKPYLKELHVRGSGWCFEHDENPLDLISPLVSTIEILDISTDRVVQGVFRNFAAANKGLKRVFVTVMEPADDAVAEEIAAASFVKAFSQCLFLEELKLVLKHELPLESALIAEKCVAFRGRSVDVFVGGIQY